MIVLKHVLDEHRDHRGPFVKRYTFQVHGNAEVVGVGMQHGVLTVWTTEASGAKSKPMTLLVCGTGQEVTPYAGYRLRHVGFAQTVAGLVWHVFVERECVEKFPASVNEQFIMIDNEQFIVIPDVQESYRVADRLRLQLRDAKAWAPTLRVDRDFVHQNFNIIFSISEGTLRYAADPNAIIQRAADFIVWELRHARRGWS